MFLTELIDFAGGVLPISYTLDEPRKDSFFSYFNLIVCPINYDPPDSKDWEHVVWDLSEPKYKLDKSKAQHKKISDLIKQAFL